MTVVWRNEEHTRSNTITFSLPKIFILSLFNHNNEAQLNCWKFHKPTGLNHLVAAISYKIFKKGGRG